MATGMQFIKTNREREQASPREGETMTNFTTSMTNFTTRMMIAAATVVVAAGAASAQTLKADIPFTFRAGKTVMAAGTYRIEAVSQLSGRPAFRLQAAGGQRAILLVPTTSADANKAWVAKGAPVLSFACIANRCSLAQVWTGGPATAAYQLPQEKMDKDEPVHVALIEMRSEKSE
jgi:hypothetical protein